MPQSAGHGPAEDAPSQCVIAGAGDLGREAYDAALAAGVTVTAFVDDRPDPPQVRGLPVLAPGEAPAGHGFLVAIADPSARGRLAALLAGRGLIPVTIVDPRAIIGPETTVAPGSLILGGAFVSSSVTIGAHCQVHYNATIGHDAVLGERVTVYPGANVSGEVQLGAGVTVGSNAVVLQDLTVHDGAFVGAGAVVTRDVAPGAVMVGNPARARP